ncbi:MAG: NADPH-dependent FMN reductase, partial [Acidiferrobacterales bacterium]
RSRSVAIMGATPGAMGTRMAQTAWLPVFRALGAKLWFGSTLYVGGASKVFDDSGKLVDEEIRERLKSYMSGFAAFVAA